MFVSREEGPEWGQHGNASECQLSNLMMLMPQNPLGQLPSAFNSDEDISRTTKEKLHTQQVGVSVPFPMVLMPSSGFYCDPTCATCGLIMSFNYPAMALSLGQQQWREV